MDARELTRAERAAIRKLVKRWCANYDPEYGCLPLGCECYMLNKWWTDAYCRYFREAVLPLAPELARALSCPGHKAELRRLRETIPPTGQTGLLLRRLQGGREAQAASGIYAPTEGGMWTFRT